MGNESFEVSKVIKYLIDVTSQPLATADLHILEPRNPFPPQITILFAADMLELF